MTCYHQWLAVVGRRPVPHGKVVVSRQCLSCDRTFTKEEDE